MPKPSARDYRQQEREITLTTSQTRKSERTKRVKSEPAGQEPEAADGHQAKKQRQSLDDKGAARVEAQVKVIESVLSDMHTESLLSGYPDIPKVFFQKYHITRAELMTAVAELTAALSSRIGKAKQLVDTGKSVLKDFQALCQKIQDQADSLQDLGVQMRNE